MFEDSLVESQGRIRTHSRWFAIGSFIAQAALLVLLILYPLFHPEALPRQSLEHLLIAPPPPQAAPHVETHATALVSRTALSMEAQFAAPRRIPASISTEPDNGPPSSSTVIGGSPDGSITGLPGGVDLGAPPPPATMARPPAPKRPLVISSGVATGQLISPIRPIYPAIAKAARIQGTVMIAATISRQGDIENLHVIDGPPMLRQAAIDAVSVARYRPFLLNGEPVEVETSIRVNFSLTE
jgi:periplasmic protein TonB